MKTFKTVLKIISAVIAAVLSVIGADAAIGTNLIL